MRLELTTLGSYKSNTRINGAISHTKRQLYNNAYQIWDLNRDNLTIFIFVYCINGFFHLEALLLSRAQIIQIHKIELKISVWISPENVLNFETHWIHDSHGNSLDNRKRPLEHCVIKFLSLPSQHIQITPKKLATKSRRKKLRNRKRWRFQIHHRDPIIP